MSTPWVATKDVLPGSDTPVLIVHNGRVRIGEMRWEIPGWEDTFPRFRYWDDPENDGQEWEWDSVTHWAPLPAPPTP